VQWCVKITYHTQKGTIVRDAVSCYALSTVTTGTCVMRQGEKRQNGRKLVRSDKIRYRMV
jgi:hypothetical protein